MSAEETVINLFDSYWFEHGVFSSKPLLSTAKSTPFLQEPEIDDKPKLNRISTLMRKSYSDQFLSSKLDCSSPSQSGSPSPKSVLGPQLRTILSGKEVESFEDSSPKLEQEINIDVDEDLKPRFSTKPDGIRKSGASNQNWRRRGRKSGSRSLSELEFEELKGFMDLGFVFSDDDRDSRLVSIIPGLQRLGKNVQETEKEFGETSSVSRPYLSEAWDCLEDEKREKNALMDWRIPAFGNEIELKDHLRFWAHSVASAVR